MLQGAINRCQEQEADELGFYAALKRGTRPAQKPSLISAAVITPVGYRCNLDCDYCFNKRGHNVAKHPAVMSEEILEKAIREVLSVSENPKFIWHGGEPLLAGIGFYQKALALEQKYGLPLDRARNAVQTNGTLLDEDWALFFKENNFEVGLSLDGPEEIHNAHRKYPSKQGSFPHVMRAIENLNKHKNSFGIVTVITDKVLHPPGTFLDFFIRNKLSHLSINPCLTPGFAAQDYADFMCRLFDAWLTSDMPELNVSLFDGLIQSFLNLHSNICWLNGHCHKIIRVDQAGDVWPCCDRYLPFKQYKFGNIQKDSLAEILAGTAYGRFRDTFGKLPARCAKCEWNHICKGGCAYHRLIHGQGEDAEDFLCGAYKQIFQYVFQIWNQMDHSNFT